MPKGQFTLGPEARMEKEVRQQVYKWVRIYKEVTGKTFNFGALGAKRGPKPGGGKPGRKPKADKE